MQELEADVAIIGGGFGAIAAALAIMEGGGSVVLTDEYQWIGGQVTSQGLNVPDEMNYPAGEHAGFNRTYYEFRERVRAYYRKTYGLSEFGKTQLYLNPGNALCSNVAAQASVAHKVITEWLAPFVASGQLQVLNPVIPVAAARDAERVASVTCERVGNPAERYRICASFFIDGTENGDTYPLLGIGYRVGSEAVSDFGEPDADDEANRGTIQCFTYCASVEFVPGGDHTIEKTANYETLKRTHAFHLNGPDASPDDPTDFFRGSYSKQGGYRTSFFYYRSTLDTRNFAPRPGLYDHAVINVGPNDFFEEAYLENPEKDRVLEDAKNLTRAYLYWLQTEAPRDDGGFGYPELRPCPEDTGTPDGIAQAPYVREGRRLKACQTVTQNDLAVKQIPGVRARDFSNSGGVGGFLIDIHQRSGNKPGKPEAARPYQIPLAALVSPELSNFAVANKGIGVTQIANGAYRLHPIEWAIGEATGLLASTCLCGGVSHPNLTGRPLLDFQIRLLERGAPLYWYDDLAVDDPAFVAGQILAVKGIWPGDPNHLRFGGHLPIAIMRREFNGVMERLASCGVDVSEFSQVHNNAHNARKGDVIHRLYEMLKRRDRLACLIED